MDPTGRDVEGLNYPKQHNYLPLQDDPTFSRDTDGWTQGVQERHRTPGSCRSTRIYPVCEVGAHRLGWSLRSMFSGVDVGPPTLVVFWGEGGVGRRVSRQSSVFGFVGG